MRGPTFLLCLVSAVLGGCLVEPVPGPETTMRSVVGPAPPKTDWPEDLEGPFSRRSTEHVKVPSHDGVLLDGYLSFPDLPPGVRAPVVLTSTPYQSMCYVHPGGGPSCKGNPESDGWWDATLNDDEATAGIGILPIRWIERGFVLANFNVRGTGESAGCHDAGGLTEQRDQKALVDWLAAQEWSNGRVGMGGISYDGWTTWQAATQAPDALKAVVSLAPVVDFYELMYTPQGARITAITYSMGPYFQQLQTTPPMFTDPSTAVGETVSKTSCPPSAATTEIYGSYPSGARDASFYKERNLTALAANVKVPMLQVQGYRDPGHFFQDRSLTAQLPDQLPVREIRGWWGHAYPGASGTFDPIGGEENWEDIVIGWMEFWLKGKGDAPRLGVEHLDQMGGWHESTEWPPAEADDETLFLVGQTLASIPGVGDATFRSAPPLQETGYLGVVSSYTPIGDVYDGELGGAGASLCPAPAGAPQVSAPFMIEATKDVVIAGNPRLDLVISSDLPGGIVSATMFALEPGFRCEDGVPEGATWLGFGAADLEYYETRYTARAFPVGEKTPVSIDLTDVTALVPAGHRFAIVVSHGEIGQSLAQPTRAPSITIHAGDSESSRLVVPILKGSLGGLQG